MKVSTTALNVKASTASKSVKKTTNTAAKKAAKKTIKVGDYVKPTRQQVRNRPEDTKLGKTTKA